MFRGTKRLGRRALRGQGGFTLVELLVVVGIVVALTAVSIVSVTQFAGKGEEGATAAELDTVQAAMDTMMADVGIVIVTANDLSTTSTTVQDFTSVPTEGALASYIRENPVNYYYCWDAAGKVSQLFASGACP